MNPGCLVIQVTTLYTVVCYTFNIITAVLSLSSISKLPDPNTHTHTCV